MQFSSSFLEGIADYVDPGLPFISLSKGLELNTQRMMSQIIPQAMKNPRQPFIALSGPSFALELMNKLPTANRTVGVRLGSREELDDILSSMNQVAEGVSTAGAVISLAQKYNVKMPVLTAVARIMDNELTSKKAILELTSLP
ncbi:hypothetical protein QYF36_017089 [Acer negundo]|nr:hypothetical protein QYF36_017089 [Acer negundo]